MLLILFPTLKVMAILQLQFVG